MEARRLRGSCRSPVPRCRSAAWSDRDGGNGVTRRAYESAASRTAVEWHLCLLPTQGGHRVPAWAALTAPRSGAPFGGGSLPVRVLSIGAPAGALERNPGHHPAFLPMSHKMPLNTSLSCLRHGQTRVQTFLGVSGKALSLNGIKLTVLQDPQRSDCLPREALAGSSGSRSPCFGTAQAAGRACTSRRGHLPHPGMGALSGRGENPSGGLGLRGRVAAPCDVS